MSSSNITLIGMPGSGKSTVGRPLAGLLGYDFLDTDLVIEQGEGKLLGDVLAGTTLQGFLDLESRYINRLSCSRTVISTGGSVVYCPLAMQHLKTMGRVIYLDVPVPVLESRLSDLAGRGVVIGPHQTLRDLETERRPMYERHAHLTIQCGHRSAWEVAEEVVRQVESRR